MREFKRYILIAVSSIYIVLGAGGASADINNELNYYWFPVNYSYNNGAGACSAGYNGEGGMGMLGNDVLGSVCMMTVLGWVQINPLET